MRLLRTGYAGAMIRPVMTGMTPTMEYALELLRMYLNRYMSTPVVATLAMAYSK